MLDLDALLESAVTAAELENGVSPQLLKARGHLAGGAAVAATTPAPAPDAWSGRAWWLAWEDDLLREAFTDRYGPETTDELIARVARQLGRTPTGVHVRAKRINLSLRAKQLDELSVRDTGDLLGKCGKSIAKLVHRGLFPARRSCFSGRVAYYVRKDTLKRWLVRWQNWIYFDANKIQDEALRSLVLRKQSLWDDAWWTTEQVAQYHDVHHKDALRYIYKGWLPAVRWHNWMVLRSDATRPGFTIHKEGKGKWSPLTWAKDADRYIVLAYAVGVPLPVIAERVAMTHNQVRHRLSVLRRDIPATVGNELLGRYDLRGNIWADWRKHRAQFPGLARAVGRFHTGRRLSNLDRLHIWGVLRSWALAFAETAEQEHVAQKLVFSHHLTVDRLRAVYAELQSWGIDPLENRHE